MDDDTENRGARKQKQQNPVKFIDMNGCFILFYVNQYYLDLSVFFNVCSHMFELECALRLVIPKTSISKVTLILNKQKQIFINVKSMQKHKWTSWEGCAINASYF